MKYNPQKHHRRSVRLQGYDYSKAGAYFITICTQNRKCLFGEITDEKMILNDVGKIAQKCWQKIPDHFPHVILHEYVIMPNHVHGIIELVRVQNFEPVHQNFEPVPQNFEPVPQNFEPRQRNKFQKIIPRSVGSIVRGYKIGVTVGVQNIEPVHPHQNIEPVHPHQNFEPLPPKPPPSRTRSIWQRNYHEHIIRDEQSYNRISKYIIKNPSKWIDDKFFL